MALIIRTDGSTEEINNPTLEQLQEAVGGYIEYVPIRTDKTGPFEHWANYMYCNEEGKLKGLEYNMRATVLIDFDDAIVGNVVVMYEGEDD